MPKESRSKSKATNSSSPAVERSSGNVFADLGLPNAELMLAKAKLVQRIRELITTRKLTQSKAAALLGIDQPKVSALLRGKVTGYSLDRLFRFLTALGQDVVISIRPQTSATNEPAILVQ